MRQLQPHLCTLLPSAEPGPTAASAGISDAFCCFPGTAFEVQATFMGCATLKGIRALVHREAQRHLAYYLDGPRTESISYEGSDLKVRLGFKTEEQALRFQNLLLDMNAGDYVSSLHNCVTSTSAAAITTMGLGERVLINHYDASDSNSPGTTVADIPGDNSSVTSSVSAAINSDFVQYQSVEASYWLQTEGVDSAHVWPLSKCTSQQEKKADDNRLALSGGFHKAFDGPHHGCPTIAIRPATEQETSFSATSVPPTVGVGPNKRCKVEVVIECYGHEQVNWCVQRVKAGSQRIANGSAAGIPAFRSWVHVSDPEFFRKCLQRKYGAIKDMWTADRT